MTGQPDWLPASWPAPPGVIAGCTTRKGGVSVGRFGALNLGLHVGDSEDCVRENRARFESGCDLPFSPVWLNQTHGPQIVTDPDRDTVPDADAILGTQPDSVCAVMIADCLPILFASTDGQEIAAAHAGWRGLCSGVVETTVHAFTTPAEQLLAWLGPAISQRHFEVGKEVREAFMAANVIAERCFVANARGRFQADLYGLARQRLAAVGVTAIYGGDYCTFAQPERFFSYRRDGQCGRMASFICRRG